MKERPIPFSGAMVRALLAGEKSQTRRVAKPKRSIEPMTDECPYGQPGDRLWVREAWRAPLAFELTPPREIPSGTPVVYQADGAGSLPHFNAGKLRPGMFMPRWASRLALEVAEVRVQRLQAISEADALAEGIDLDALAESQDRYDMVADQNMTGRPTAGGAYRTLWEQINGPGSWDANPWVWAVTFQPPQKPDQT